MLSITVLFIPSLTRSKPEGARPAVNLTFRGDASVIVARKEVRGGAGVGFC